MTILKLIRYIMKKYLLGRNTKKIINVYKKLLDVFFEIEDFQMPLSIDLINPFQKIRSDLESIDINLDDLIEIISCKH